MVLGYLPNNDEVFLYIRWEHGFVAELVAVVMVNYHI